MSSAVNPKTFTFNKYAVNPKTFKFIKCDVIVNGISQWFVIIDL